MAKAAKPVRRARATRKTKPPLFRLELTNDGRKALALLAARNAADAMRIESVRGMHSTPATFAAYQAARDALRAQADTIVARIAGDGMRRKHHPVAQRDDLLTLAIIAHTDADSHGWARRALILEVLACGGLAPGKGMRLVKRRR